MKNCPHCRQPLTGQPAACPGCAADLRLLWAMIQQVRSSTWRRWLQIAVLVAATFASGYLIGRMDK